MKTTLKDIPDSPQKRAFEKELRVIFASIPPNATSPYLIAQRRLIKEILGEMP